MSLIGKSREVTLVNIKEIPKRKDVPENLTWDLTTIFKNKTEFEKYFNDVKESIPEIQGLKGTMKQSPEQLLKVVQQVMDSSRKYEKIAVYAELLGDTDTGNNTNQG